MEGGWKTPPSRVSSRAKSPGLIGLIGLTISTEGINKALLSCCVSTIQKSDFILHNGEKWGELYTTNVSCKSDNFFTTAGIAALLLFS